MSKLLFVPDFGWELTTYSDDDFLVISESQCELVIKRFNDIATGCGEDSYDIQTISYCSFDNGKTLVIGTFLD
jgi:hypothetical protein